MFDSNCGYQTLQYCACEKFSQDCQPQVTSGTVRLITERHQKEPKFGPNVTSFIIIVLPGMPKQDNVHYGDKHTCTCSWAYS